MKTGSPLYRCCERVLLTVGPLCVWLNVLLSALFFYADEPRKAWLQLIPAFAAVGLLGIHAFYKAKIESNDKELEELRRRSAGHYSER